MFGQQDTRIYIIERDIYARQAMVSYLSWDRRTRVIGQSSVPHELIASIKSDPAVANLDVVILDDSLAVHPTGLAGLIKLILFHAPEAAIICLTRDADPERILAAGRAGARAYLSREHVGIGLASAVHFTNWHQFVITQDLTLFGDKLCQQLDLLIT
nr:response regulator transcription factor [Anaerolineae bacterium]